MTKESVRKFLEDVKEDSALQDIRRGLNKGKNQVGIVNYLTEEANQRGYKFTALELEEELLPWLLSEQSERLETTQESIKGSGEKQQSIHEPIEKPESTNKSTQKLGKMATKKPTKASTEASTEATEASEASTEASESLTEASTEASEASTETSTEASIEASKKIADEIATTSYSTVEMLSLMALPKPTKSLPEPPKKITALEKVQKSKLSDLKGRIWA